MCHVSCVMCHVSCIMCHLSPVTCHQSHVTCQKIDFIFVQTHLDKVMELVGGRSVIKGANPVQFFYKHYILKFNISVKHLNPMFLTILCFNYKIFMKQIEQSLPAQLFSPPQRQKYQNQTVSQVQNYISQYKMLQLFLLKLFYCQFFIWQSPNLPKPLPNLPSILMLANCLVFKSFCIQGVLISCNIRTLSLKKFTQ